MSPSDKIVFLLERIGRIIQNDAHEASLKPAQWEALRYIARANRFSRNPSGLTAYMGLTKGTVSQTLIALERKGLIVKKPLAHDRRNISVELTPAGKDMLNEDPILSLDTVCNKMKAKDRDLVEQSLKNLLTTTLEERKGVLFGPCHTCKYFNKNAKDGGPHRCALLDAKLTESDSNLHCVENVPRTA